MATAYAIICCPKSNFSVARESAAPEPGTDLILNAADFPAGRKGRLRVARYGQVNYWYRMDLWDRFAAEAVPGSYYHKDGITDYEIVESNAFTIPEGLKSFQVRLWQEDDTKLYTIQKISLQIESA